MTWKKDMKNMKNMKNNTKNIEALYERLKTTHRCRRNRTYTIRPHIATGNLHRCEQIEWIWMDCNPNSEKKKKLIECGSCTIPDSVKRNFSVSELELAAIEMALRKMRLMTIGNNKIIVKTDHLPLIGILKKPLEKIETKRLMKYAEKLQDYSFCIKYVQGTKNEVADALSRNPVSTPPTTEVEIENRLMHSKHGVLIGKCEN